MPEQSEDRAPGASAGPPPQPRLWTALLGSALVAGIVVLVGTFLTQRFLIAPLVEERDALRVAENAGAARVAALQAELADLEARAERLREELSAEASAARFGREASALLREPGLEAVELGGGDALPEASARLLWNEAGRGYLHARGLPVPADGSALVLWIVTADGHARALGRLEPHASGEAALLLELPAGGGIARALITEESDVGEAPQGPERLAWSRAP